jgi:serine/threonine-protein kinase
VFTESPLHEGKFLPGRLIAGRYRIIALLGKGGMGEVYRADDLTLGQAVALKFLPEQALHDAGLLERFRNEVRIARRVSHPNVCRVYDVGEVDGQTFFTMEYVDGEDLASLLRRIGRLPQDKAVEIARQLCAGLAAAHAKSVLHRDLKPANIMLDGRGQVVITDFGLAGLADEIRGAEVRSGTPAYMAPEQLAGKEVSTRSDIYSLGLVLYEVFTGKRAFGEKTVGDLRSREDRTPSRPSSLVKDIDPIIEKVILRCLDPEPSARPATALAVAAALPGGDPLAAALAAGETPSPQMVAAAGETTGLRPRVAVAVFAAILIGLAIGVYINIHYSGLEKLHPELTPEVLAHRSREIVNTLGYTARPADTAYQFDYDTEFLNAVEKEKGPHNWDAIIASRPTVLLFWYRQSPKPMFASGYRDFLLTPDILTEEDPPTTLSGMVNVKLDARGRLIYFQAIPPQQDTTPPASSSPDWTPLFAAAELDPATFKPADPQWTSLGTSDARAAWTGVWPGTTRALRIEAAAYHGKPVFFSAIGDWNKPWRAVAAPKSDDWKQTAGQVFNIFALLTLILAAAWLARRHYRQGRADREGALHLATVMFVLQIFVWLSKGHFAADFDLFGVLMLTLAASLFVGGVVWIVYLAVEPWIRRRWPHAIISWSRLLSGQLRDPLVGRDILFGVGFGVLWLVIFSLSYIPQAHMGVSPNFLSSPYLLGGRAAFSQWLAQIPISIFATLQFFFLAFGLRTLLRKDWLAAVTFVLIYVGLRSLSVSHASIEIPIFICVYLVLVVIIFRFGLVPLAVAAFTVDMLGSVPFTADFSQWYMGATALTLVSVVALAGWGFYHSLGGEPVWTVEQE